METAKPADVWPTLAQVWPTLVCAAKVDALTKAVSQAARFWRFGDSSRYIVDNAVSAGGRGFDPNPVSRCSA